MREEEGVQGRRRRTGIDSGRTSRPKQDRPQDMYPREQLQGGRSICATCRMLGEAGLLPSGLCKGVERQGVKVGGKGAEPLRRGLKTKKISRRGRVSPSSFRKTSERRQQVRDASGREERDVRLRPEDAQSGSVG